MDYVVIATVDDRFKTIETEAPDKESAEQQTYDRLCKKYVGQIRIIKIEVKSEWERKVRYERSRL